jgi:hypothetical protein
MIFILAFIDFLSSVIDFAIEVVQHITKLTFSILFIFLAHTKDIRFVILLKSVFFMRIFVFYFDFYNCFSHFFSFI